MTGKPLVRAILRAGAVSAAFALVSLGLVAVLPQSGASALHVLGVARADDGGSSGPGDNSGPGSDDPPETEDDAAAAQPASTQPPAPQPPPASQPAPAQPAQPPPPPPPAPVSQPSVTSDPAPAPSPRAPATEATVRHGATSNPDRTSGRARPTAAKKTVRTPNPPRASQHRRVVGHAQPPRAKPLLHRLRDPHPPGVAAKAAPAILPLGRPDLGRTLSQLERVAWIIYPVLGGLAVIALLLGAGFWAKRRVLRL